MAYEYEGYVKNTIRTEAVFSHEIEQKYDRILELEEVYSKAKAFDEIEQAYWKSNTPENFAYDFVGIFEKHFSNGVECADDER